MTIWPYLLAAAIMAAGAAVQGSVGFGLALVSAPFLALIDPTFVPAPLLLASMSLNGLMIRHLPGGHHWRRVSWPIVGQVPGAAAGALLLTHLADTSKLGIAAGVLILIAVALTASGLHLRPTKPVLVGAGSASGFMQATVGIGGPPVALVFHRHEPDDLRAAMARFFTVSCLVSLTWLLLLGGIGWRELGEAAVLVPGTIVGFRASRWVAAHTEAHHLRVAVLVVAAAGAVMLLVRSVW